MGSFNPTAFSNTSFYVAPTEFDDTGAFNPDAFSDSAFDAVASEQPPVVVSKFTFIPEEKIIQVNPYNTTFTSVEVYMAWKTWARLNMKYLPAFKVIGSDPIGGGLFISAYFFLLNGWRVRPMSEHHSLSISGNLFVEEGGSPVVPALGNFQVIVSYTVPVQAQAYATSGGSTGTIDTSAISAAVWAYNNKTLTNPPPTAVDIANATWQHSFIEKILTVAKFIGLK
jgi:hypothetical protein